ncbi:flagellar cap protein FliD [Clostridium niameyense]|uniref:Flagellar hook-associated protein 2 n=1 Tax=Clostridium niameyense TaxID=1622073 RepID=A0A6M0R8E4_9CLOT|nr:flagellar filament capping protein FliD [Clostridium niameyense]NEZ45869.1 flagellar cap protein FliD [Clostridium niameyense]
MGEVGGISSTGNRFIGLATGMNTDDVVKKMLTGDQAKVDRAKQQQQYTEWKQESYVETIKEFRDLQSTFLDVLSPDDTNLMKSFAYTSTKATIENINENGGILDVTSLAGARKGKYQIIVKHMAKAAAVESGNLPEKINGAINFNIKIKGKSIDIKIPEDKTKEGRTAKELVSQLKNYEVSVDGKNEKLSDYLNISYSELTGKMTIASKTMGVDSTLEISSLDGSLKNVLGIDNKKVIGENAVAEIKEPGQTDFTEVIKDTNTFTIDNIKYDINSADKSKLVTINVKSDTSESVKKIKKFVEKYNSLIDKFNGKLSEKKNYKFKPLIEAQKKDMKEDEIKRWDEKCKEGILRNDMDLNNMLSNMRRAFLDGVKDAGITLRDIGITTSKDYNKKGKLEIDEGKLTKALEEDSDKIQDLFLKSSDKYEEKGIFNRVNDILNNHVGREGTIVKKAGYKDSRWLKDSYLSKNIVRQEKKIKELETRMFEKQERYYQMFARLERAMNQMNSQANWFAMQMGQ